MTENIMGDTSMVPQDTCVLQGLSEKHLNILSFVEGAGREATPDVIEDYATRLTPFAVRTLIDLVDGGYLAFSKDYRHPHALSCRGTLCILCCKCTDEADSYWLSAKALANAMNEGEDAVEKSLEALMRQGLVVCCNSLCNPVWRAI